MLVILPARLARKVGIAGLHDRVEMIKELGGKTRGLAPFQIGLVYEFPDELFEEWQDILNIYPFN